MLTLIARFLPSLLPAVSALLNPWILLAILAAFGWAGFKGYQIGAGKLETYRAEQLHQATKINTKRAQVTELVVTKYVQVAGKTEFVTRWIEKEVSDYAQANPDGMCLDDNWGGVHERAVLNTIPGPARGADGGLRASGGPAEGLRRTNGQ